MLRALSAVAVLAVTLLSAPPGADADIEPNGSLPEAEGPIVAGTHTGTIVHGAPQGVRPPEADWYIISSTGQNELVMEIAEGDRLDFILRDGAGSELTRVHMPTVDEFFSGPEYLRYTTPVTPQILYLEISHESRGTTGLSVPYEFSIGPPGALSPGFSPFAPLIWADVEPNDVRSQAFGPLRASTSYTGRKDADEDNDFFYFYAPGSRYVQLTVTTRDEVCFGREVALLSATGDELADNDLSVGLLFRVPYTTLRGWPRKHYVRVNCDSYVFRIDPPTAVVPPCRLAKLNAKRHRVRIARLKRKRKRLAWGAAERRTIRALKGSKRRLRKAERSAKALC